MAAGNGNTQEEMFTEVPRKARTSVLDQIFSEFEELDRLDDEMAAEAKREIGGRVMDIAQEGMSVVGRTRFELTHRSTVGSVVDTGLDLLSKYHAVKSEGPAILRAVQKLAGLVSS